MNVYPLDYRVLQGGELLRPQDVPSVALAARQWRWVGCTCRVVSFAVTADATHIRVRVVHDESCPATGIRSAFDPMGAQ